MLGEAADHDLEVDLELHYEEDDLVEMELGDDELADPWFAEPDALIEAIDDDGSIRAPRFKMSVVLTAAALIVTAGICFTVG